MENASRLDPFPVRVYRQWLLIQEEPADRLGDRIDESRKMLDAYMRTWRHQQNQFSIGMLFPFGGMGMGYRGGGYPGMMH